MRLAALRLTLAAALLMGCTGSSRPPVSNVTVTSHEGSDIYGVPIRLAASKVVDLIAKGNPGYAYHIYKLKFTISDATEFEAAALPDGEIELGMPVVRQLASELRKTYPSEQDEAQKVTFLSALAFLLAHEMAHQLRSDLNRNACFDECAVIEITADGLAVELLQNADVPIEPSLTFLVAQRTIDKIPEKMESDLSVAKDDMSGVRLIMKGVARAMAKMLSAFDLFERTERINFRIFRDSHDPNILNAMKGVRDAVRDPWHEYDSDVRQTLRTSVVGFERGCQVVKPEDRDDCLRTLDYLRTEEQDYLDVATKIEKSQHNIDEIVAEAETLGH